MKSFHEGQLVTVVEEGGELDGIVVHVPSLVSIEVAVRDADRGPVFRTVHPKALRERTTPGPDDDALRRRIRRGPSAARGGPVGGRAGGHGRRGHSHATGHRTTGK